MSVRSPKKLWLEQFFKGITMGVVSFTRTQVYASLNRLRRIPMGTWPALEVTDIKTAITPKSGLTAG